MALCNASLDQLAGTLVQMNADAAKTMIQSVSDAIYDRRMKGPKLSFPIEYFVGATEPVAPSSEYHSWIDPEWDTWDINQRRIYLKELFDWGGMGWFGDNLRVIRSKLIEDWLALSEPPPQKVIQHPVKTISWTE